VLLSDADREGLFARLKANATAGTISMEELERRVDVVARAQTRAEAGAAVDDLPPALPDLAGGITEASGPGRARGGRGHAHADLPGRDWRATSERFRDPRSGQVMRVWEDPLGQRHYVPDDG
jgi:hypothetical protein